MGNLPNIFVEPFPFLCNRPLGRDHISFPQQHPGRHMNRPPLASTFWRRAGAVAALALCAWAVPALALDAGQAAPEFELPGRVGNVKLSDYKGRVVYLDFWASWCGPCKQSFPWMNEMQSRYGDKGLRIVGVSVDKKQDDAKKFLDRTPARFDVVFDAEGKTPAAFGVKVMPTSFLIAPSGKVLAIHGGFREEDRDKLEREIKQMLETK
jgi:peroxiredoxin